MAAEPSPPSQKPNSPQGPFSKGDQGLPRWTLFIVAGIVMIAMFAATRVESSSRNEIEYSEFLAKVESGDVKEATWDNSTTIITGTLDDGTKFQTTGPVTPDEATMALLRSNTKLTFHTNQPNLLTDLIPVFLPILLLIGFFVWMQRRAQGQMGGIMSIGRSRAKTYSSERPATTFADVAGYEGVKTEIKEVVDFLKEPDRFSEIGARIPKGILLVGPPGTGKTLIARAVAGEAGVPFLSVSGSDFMEMFVGVGASRVRDLFDSARKMGRAIIFIDEIDSIGRKRGAGLGGGHDEREQTLNQMLSEMDGFEATEGIVMMAATNRPDILDPALLRPGRFDRQVVVPLPEITDRRQILDVHVRHKRLANDVDLDLVARGTPGMSGAELANLVNEAALHAVRQGSQYIRNIDFEYARDRVLMGAKRESMVLSDKEKELTAYHEAGHAVCAAVLDHTDPLHKVTIIPMGMALGVTISLPEEDRHRDDDRPHGADEADLGLPFDEVGGHMEACADGRNGEVDRDLAVGERGHTLLADREDVAHRDDEVHPPQAESERDPGEQDDDGVQAPALVGDECFDGGEGADGPKLSRAVLALGQPVVHQGASLRGGRGLVQRRRQLRGLEVRDRRRRPERGEEAHRGQGQRQDPGEEPEARTHEDR